MDPSVLNTPEMVQFMNEEKQRLMLTQTVAKVTDICWDKCITGTPGNKFSSSESACLSNCARRYLDMSMILVKRLQNMQ